MANQLSLKKSLNLFDSTALVIGSMIGSGIFIVSADMSRTLGAPGWLMLTWLITGILTIIAAVSYGELASLIPQFFPVRNFSVLTALFVKAATPPKANIISETCPQPI